MCVIVFEKKKWSWWDNTQNKSLCTGRLLLIIAVSIILRGELANEAVNYDTTCIQTYVPFWARSIRYQKRTVLVKFEQF